MQPCIREFSNPEWFTALRRHNMALPALHANKHCEIIANGGERPHQIVFPVQRWRLRSGPTLRRQPMTMRAGGEAPHSSSHFAASQPHNAVKARDFEKETWSWMSKSTICSSDCRLT